MSSYVRRSDLQVAESLADFVENSGLPGTAWRLTAFWQGFADILADLGPINRQLLDERTRLQEEIDSWHKAHRGVAFDVAAYRQFLTEIGYLDPDGDSVKIATENVDPEIATMAGPQLVVPLSNARFALNAANARWGSLYDALYGTNAVPQAGPLAPGKAYNAERGAGCRTQRGGSLMRPCPRQG